MDLIVSVPEFAHLSFINGSILFCTFQEMCLFLAMDVKHQFLSAKKVRKKVQGVPQSQTAAQTPRGRGNRQNQTSANRTMVRKAL